MEESILVSTKKVLGIDAGYESFDLDIVTHINAAFSVVNQLGVGPDDGFFITDETAVWGDLSLPDNQLNLVKTYVYLRVRMVFDPPGTGFLIEAMKNQIKEYEWRLSTFREVAIAETEIA